MQSARTREPDPRLSTRSGLLLGRELRGALRHQGVVLADERRALLADVDDDLAPVPEGVGKRALVGHGDGHVALAVADAEGVRRAVAGDRAGLDLPGQLVGASGLGAGRQLARGARLAGRREARVD